MPSWQGCRRPGAGELFLLAPGADSFDSRYFGVVPATHVVGRAVPLWPTPAADSH
jgi:type IV secretory pathway protease TraF